MPAALSRPGKVVPFAAPERQAAAETSAAAS